MFAGPGTVLALEDFAVQRGGWSVAVPRFALRTGEGAALLGPSGCGKTSVLLGVLGLAGGLTTRGGVQWQGEPLPRSGSRAWRELLRQEVAVVLQDAVAALDPLLPVGAQIGAATGRGREEVAGALRTLGVAADEVEGLLDRPPHRISGGQAQRCLLAVALLRRPRLVVADEPTASLDGANAEGLRRNLELLRGEGAALLLATHDRPFVRALDAQVLEHAGGAFRPGGEDPPAWPPAPASTPGEVVLRARGVGVAFGDRQVLEGVDLELRRGEVVALVGPSGGGKTTLARILAGHLRPDAGTVHRPDRARSVQMLFQDARGSLTPGRTVRWLVDEVRVPDFDPVAAAARLKLPAVCLERTAVALSGGERRRAALLRALAVAPEVLVCDEPLASLDRDTGLEVTRSLLELARERELALLCITHDEEWAGAVAHRVLRMEGGRPC